MKNLIASAALMFASLSATAITPKTLATTAYDEIEWKFNAQEAIRPTIGGLGYDQKGTYLQFTFRSENVCDRYDNSDENGLGYTLVYCVILNTETNESVEEMEMVVSEELYNEWVTANMEGRLFQVNVEWHKEKGYFEINKLIENLSYITWEPEGEFLYPEL